VRSGMGKLGARTRTEAAVRAAALPAATPAAAGA
jgi:DNA-binding CsgD family transcriptional regulator